MCVFSEAKVNLARKTSVIDLMGVVVLCFRPRCSSRSSQTGFDCHVSLRLVGFFDVLRCTSSFVEFSWGR